MYELLGLVQSELYCSDISIYTYYRYTLVATVYQGIVYSEVAHTVYNPI